MIRKIVRKTSALKLPTFSANKILFVLGVSACMISNHVFAQAKQAPTPAITLKVQAVAGNLEALTDMAFPGNGDIWVTEQRGKIRLIRNGKLSDVPVMDLKSKMVKNIHNGYEERGLLGIALHPKFKSNKKFYVFYSAPTILKGEHSSVVAEYVLLASGQADPNSGRVIFTTDQPEGNHNGGCMKFGRDGYLYFSLGDGGGQHDKHGQIGNGQDLSVWLGKILRIDVNTTTGYKVPKDNPFVGKANVKPEIWAYGFRNPWRFSFDKVSGQLFAGEVGQDLWEEVDIVKKGANYGWRIVEGTHCHEPATGCDIKGITMPICEYPHKEGVSVTGGYVYNGKQLPSLKSKYVFADWTGPVFYLQKTGATWQRGSIVLQNIPAGTKITSFGEDAEGELYILTNPDTGPGNTKGVVYKIVKG